jgi:tetratricopeptide (TPR) repeat protein
VGRLLDGLRASSGDRSVIVIAGDHGESLGEHGERYHSRTLYEGAVHVPLLIAAPGLVSPGVRDSEEVGLVDVAPTLFDLLGIEDPDDLDGESLLTALSAPSASPIGPAGGRTLYLETLNTYVDNGWAPLYALRRHDAKYISAPRPEYYDLARDPHETHDLLAGTRGAAPPPGSALLAASLRARLAGQPDVTAADSDRGDGGLDPEVRRRLESLGYLSAGGERPAAGTDLPDPKDMLPLHDRLLAAREALARGDLEQAVRLGRTLVRASPRDRAALQLLGEAYASMGELGRAERALRRHLAIGPSVAAEVLLAQVLMQQGRLGEASDLLDAAAELDPDHGAVPLARGDLFLVQGRPDRARASYEEARQIDPTRFSGLSAARVERLDRLLAAHRGAS